MKKKAILLLLLLLTLSLFFIPVTQQKDINVKGSFFNVYTSLSLPTQWEQWRSDLRHIAETDSSKISVQKGTNSFSLTSTEKTLNVKYSGNSFLVDDGLSGKSIEYEFAVVPKKDNNSTSVTVLRRTSLISYLLAGGELLADTHISDLKIFMETDSLHYGYKIVKTKVPEDNLIEIKKKVLASDKFTSAAGMLASLHRFIAAHNTKQMQPVIAQFLPKGKDSMQVNVGIFIDKVVKPEKDIAFVTMPKGGPLYSAKFSGKFDKRGKVYESVHRYFADHGYQIAILPFETYLDNKLPVSDTSTVNIRVNFSAYF